MACLGTQGISADSKNEQRPPTSAAVHGLMQKADNVTKVWTLKTFLRRYYEAVKVDSQAVQKARKFPRTV